MGGLLVVLAEDYNLIDGGFPPSTQRFPIIKREVIGVIIVCFTLFLQLLVASSLAE